MREGESEKYSGWIACMDDCKKSGVDWLKQVQVLAMSMSLQVITLAQSKDVM